MARRVFAALIVIAGIAAVFWVTTRGDTTEAVSPVTTTAESPAADGAATESAAGEDTTAPEATAPTSTDDGANMQPTDDASAEVAPVPTSTPEPAIDAPENFGPRMDLVQLDGWLNTDASSIDEFDGKVLLVEMWTFGCHNCKARIPHNQSYYEEFAGDDFEIIGVHAPEFSYEADVANIEQALVDLGVSWPVALDTNKKNFRAWQPGSTNYWPRTFVVDQNGDVRYDHIGEGRYEELRETLRHLIDNPPAPTTAP